jgi:hypothetical protein
LYRKFGDCWADYASFFLLFVGINGVEGMPADRSAELRWSAGRSLKAASPTKSGGRRQPKLEAAP